MTGSLRLAFWATIALALATAAYSAYNSLPWSDEGWFSSAAYNLARNGSMGTPVLEARGNGGHLTDIEKHTYWVFPGFLISQGLWYKLFPATIFWTRVHSMVWFCLALAGLFFYLRKLFPESDSIPWLGTMLFGGSYIGVSNAAFGRPDMACCALGLAGMAVYLHYREKHFPLALVAGHALIALSGLMHPNGIYHWVAFVALILWMDARRIRVSSFLYSLIPYLVLGGLWAIYLAQDPRAVQDQLHQNALDRWHGSWNLLRVLKNELDRYWQTYGLVTGGVNVLKMFSLILDWSAVVACLLIGDLRRRPAVKLLLIQVGLYFAGLSVFNQKLSFYLVHIAPFYAMIAAVWVDWLYRAYAPAHAVMRRLIPVAIAGLIALELGGVALRAYTRSYVADERALVSYIESHARPGDNLTGSASLLYGLHFDPRLKDDAYLGTQTGRVPDLVILEILYRQLYQAWDTERPADMRAVKERLSHYRLAFHRGDYQVWVRQDPRAAGSGPAAPDAKVLPGQNGQDAAKSPGRL